MGRYSDEITVCSPLESQLEYMTRVERAGGEFRRETEQEKAFAAFRDGNQLESTVVSRILRVDRVFASSSKGSLQRREKRAKDKFFYCCSQL